MKLDGVAVAPRLAGVDVTAREDEHVVTGLERVVGGLAAAGCAAQSFDERAGTERPRDLVDHRGGGARDAGSLPCRDEGPDVEVDHAAEAVVADEQHGTVGDRGVDANLMPVIHPQVGLDRRRQPTGRRDLRLVGHAGIRTGPRDGAWCWHIGAATRMRTPRILTNGLRTLPKSRRTPAPWPAEAGRLSDGVERCPDNAV